MIKALSCQSQNIFSTKTEDLNNEWTSIAFDNTDNSLSVIEYVDDHTGKYIRDEIKFTLNVVVIECIM